MSTREEGGEVGGEERKGGWGYRRFSMPKRHSNPSSLYATILKDHTIYVDMTPYDILF